jgi:hypothetical protein
MRQRRVPCLPIGPVQLHVEHVLMAFPGLGEQEPVLGFRVAMQRGAVIHRLLPHRVQDMMKKRQKLIPPRGDDLELDDIGDRHDVTQAG